MSEQIIYIHRANAHKKDGARALVLRGESGGTVRVVETGLEVHTEADTPETRPLIADLGGLGGIHMLEEAPPLPFYGVPWLCVFAGDGAGGYFACAGGYPDRRETSPVYHLSPEGDTRQIADSFFALLHHAVMEPDWRASCMSGGPWPALPEDAEGRAALAEALGLSNGAAPEASDGPVPLHLRVFPSRQAAEEVFPIQEMEALLANLSVPVAGQRERFPILDMEPAHYRGKGFVHYTSWQETYTGIMDQRIIDSQSLERCEAMAERYPENTLVVLDREAGNKVVGFACYVPKARDHASVPEAGEVAALYLLREYQGLGLGRSLLEACLQRLERPDVVLFVLEGNQRAMDFYTHMGFRPTGHRLTHIIRGAEMPEIEMLLGR